MNRRRPDAAESTVIRFAGSAALVGLVVLAAAGCYRAQVVAGPPAPDRLTAVSAKDWPRVKGLRLHVFNTGMNRVSPLLVGAPAPWRPAPAFVIEHPTQGLIVFDAGLSAEIAERGEGALHFITRQLFETRSLAGRDLAQQMRDAELVPEAVTTVILSHLHFDHVGAAAAFPSATFYSGAGERAASRSRMDGFEPSATDWVTDEAWKEIDFSDAAPFATFDRTLDLFGDRSVVLVGGGGHTVGGLAALVSLPRGPVLLAGDTVVHFDWLEGNDVQRIVVDAERAADVRNRVRRLMKLVPDVAVIPGHDLSRVPEDRADVVLHDAGSFAPEAWPLG